MKVEEARTDGSNYRLLVVRSLEGEILDEANVETAMKSSEIFGEIKLTGYKGINYFVTTTNNPSMDQINLFNSKLKEIIPLVL